MSLSIKKKNISYSILISLLMTIFIISSVFCVGILKKTYVNYFFISSIPFFIMGAIFSYARITNCTTILPRGSCGLLKRNFGKLCFLLIHISSIVGLVKLLLKSKNLLVMFGNATNNAKSLLTEIGLSGVRLLRTSKAAVFIFLIGIVSKFLFIIAYSFYKLLHKDIKIYDVSSTIGSIPSHLKVSSVKTCSDVSNITSSSGPSNPISIKNGNVDSSVVSGAQKDFVKNSLSAF